LAQLLQQQQAFQKLQDKSNLSSKDKNEWDDEIEKITQEISEAQEKIAKLEQTKKTLKRLF
jgi:predicted  nucleic acid-binding Zn-ribbon protein